MTNSIKDFIGLIVVIGILSACVGSKPMKSKHDLLVDNNCYDKYSFDSGDYVVITPSDLCLSIAYTESEF